MVAEVQVRMVAATMVRAWALVGATTEVQAVVEELMYVGSAAVEQGRR